MRIAYFLLGIAFLFIIGGALYFYSPTALAPEKNIEKILTAIIKKL